MLTKNNQGFIRLNRGEIINELLKNHEAFILLAVIALRARRKSGFNLHGLELGEALIGDYKNYGLTERKYRTAKENLKKWGFSTFKPTTKGTIAKLTDSSIYDINLEADDEQADNQPTNDRRTTDERPTTNNKGNKVNKVNKVNKKEKINKKENVCFPENLQSEEFKSVWQEWQQHRKEKNQTLTLTTIKRQIKMLSENSSQAIAIIEQSIEKGWTGLFPIKGEKNENFNTRTNRQEPFATGQKIR